MGNEKKEPTQNEILLRIVKGVPLFHDGDDVYAKVPVGPHYENWPVRSRVFKRWLSHMFYLQQGKSPSNEALSSALTTIEGRGMFSFPEMSANVRVARFEDKIYLDLGNAAWQAVEVSPAGWRIVDEPPVKFVRPSGLLPLPKPNENGDLGLLKPFLNIDVEEQFVLIAAWLLGTMHPAGPYAIMVINGEQGSGKSTAVKILRNIIDRNKSPIRCLPRSERDLQISAKNSWVLAFDNISGIPFWLSDAFCRLATGGGLATRTLYTDIEETIFESKRPLILNGITDMVRKHDLADRCIYITFPPFGAGTRNEEKDIEKAFRQKYPKILGGLLDAVSMGLKNRDNGSGKSMPRMADFCSWVMAAEPALPWEEGGFYEAYTGNIASIVEMSVQGSVVGNAIMNWFEGKTFWEGTATELLADLENFVEEKTKKLKAWPVDATRLARRITQVSSFLRQVGIDIEIYRTGKKRIYRIKNKNSVNSVISVIDQKKQDVTNDAKNGHDAISVIDNKNNNLASYANREEKQEHISGHDTNDADDANFTSFSKSHKCDDCPAYDKTSNICHGTAYYQGKTGRGIPVGEVQDCARD